jgi:hypothetical protein
MGLITGAIDLENINTTYQDQLLRSPQQSKDETELSTIDCQTIQSAPTRKTPGTNTGKAFIALAALILFTCILILEIIASVAASKGRGKIESKVAAWCSPIFQPFGLAVQSGCTFYAATQDPTKGIGCVNLPAHLQSDWLSATETLVPIALVLQGLDLVILSCVHGSRRLRGIKMQRPWFTVCLSLFLPARFFFLSL